MMLLAERAGATNRSDGGARFAAAAGLLERSRRARARCGLDLCLGRRSEMRPLPPPVRGWECCSRRVESSKQSGCHDGRQNRLSVQRARHRGPHSRDCTVSRTRNKRAMSERNGQVRFERPGRHSKETTRIDHEAARAACEGKNLGEEEQYLTKSIKERSRTGSNDRRSREKRQSVRKKRPHRP